MRQTRNIVLILLLLLMTIAYCWFIYLIMGLFRVLLTNWGISALPNITAYLSVKPLPWQILAFISLIVNVSIGFFIFKKENDPNAFLGTAICHITWIFTCFLMHGVGFLFPFIIKVIVIK